MSKRLKLVSVRLKPDREVYKNATFATATDVAFLMAKEIAEFDNETIGVLNLKALLKMLGWRILQGFQSLFHFLKKRCFHRLLREYPTDSLL